MHAPKQSVPDRLRELHQLQDGWHHSEGRKPPVAGLLWLEQAWKAHWDESLPKPFVYPTLQGGVQLEWCVGDVEASLDVNVSTRQGDFLACRIASNGSIEDAHALLNLASKDQWEELKLAIARLRQRLPETC